MATWCLKRLPALGVEAGEEVLPSVKKHPRRGPHEVASRISVSVKQGRTGNTTSTGKEPPRVRQWGYRNDMIGNKSTSDYYMLGVDLEQSHFN